MDPSTTEAHVANTIVTNAQIKFNSYSEFGGRLNRILKKLPEIKKEEETQKPYSFTVSIQ